MRRYATGPRAGAAAIVLGDCGFQASGAVAAYDEVVDCLDLCLNVVQVVTVDC